MSAPFGGHPTFGTYLHWVRSQGCLVQTGIARSSNGFVETLTRIETSDRKKWVVVVGTPQDEHLPPTRIDYLNRRLGLESNFFTLPSEE